MLIADSTRLDLGASLMYVASLVRGWPRPIDQHIDYFGEPSHRSSERRPDEQRRSPNRHDGKRCPKT
jgi:hypothetical protein